MTYEELYALCQEWLDEMNLKESTKRTYGTYIRQWIKWMERKKITNPSWSEALDFLDDTGRRRTTEVLQSSLRKFYDWLGEKGLAENIFLPYEYYDEREEKEPGITEKQTKKLLSLIDRSTEAGRRDFAMIAAQTSSNLTAKKVLAANVGDFQILPNGEPALWDRTKNDYIRLNPAAGKAIQEYLKLREPKSPDEPLFKSVSNRAGTTGGRINRSSLSRLHTQRLRLIGYRANDIRAASFSLDGVT